MNTPITLSALGFVLFMFMVFAIGVYLGHRFTRVSGDHRDTVRCFDRDYAVDDAADMAIDG